MLHFLVPCGVAFGTVISLTWVGYYALAPSRSVAIWATVFLLFWLAFICSLIFGCLN
jgi:hypothetical protein